jgi:hypothetical protein
LDIDSIEVMLRILDETPVRPSNSTILGVFIAGRWATATASRRSVRGAHVFTPCAAGVRRG